MLGKILGKIGLPLLVKFVSSSLGNINNDFAQKAGLALKDVDTAISLKQISLDELKEANRHLEKSQEIENSVDLQTLSTIHETMRQELKSEDRFVRFWRPAFGYSVALSWMMNMATICYVVASDNQRAPEIIEALVETTSLWGIALGVLGVSVVKSNQEKQPANASNALAKIVNKLS